MCCRRVVTACVVALALAGPAVGRAQEAPAPPAARLEQIADQLRQLERQLAALGAVPPTAPAAAAGSADGRIDALDQQIRVLERKLELEREAQAEAVKSAPAVTVGSSGFSFKSGDGNFQIRFKGLLHSDARLYVDDGADAVVNTLGVRRVRPIFEATMFKRFDFRVMPDFGDGRTVLQDAYIDLRFTPAFVVRGGKFKSPFGIERLVSASDLLFTERGLPTSVAPNRDVGFMVHGDLVGNRLSYALGIFDGVLDGSSTDADDRDGKDVTGRLFVHPFRGTKRDRLEGLGFGGAASYGPQRGAVAAANLATYRTTGQTYFRYRGDGTAAGTAFADGTRYRYSAQAYYYSGRLGVLAEQVFSSQEVRRASSSADVGVNAWMLAGSWVVTGEKASYRAVAPTRVFEPAKRAWGAVELTARVNTLTIGDEAFPVFADPRSQARRARAWTTGVNWYLNRGVKLVLDYEQVHFDGGAGEGNRPTERAVLSRLQFGF